MSGNTNKCRCFHTGHKRSLQGCNEWSISLVIILPVTFLIILFIFRSVKCQIKMGEILIFILQGERRPLQMPNFHPTAQNPKKYRLLSCLCCTTYVGFCPPSASLLCVKFSILFEICCSRICSLNDMKLRCGEV